LSKAERIPPYQFSVTQFQCDFCVSNYLLELGDFGAHQITQLFRRAADGVYAQFGHAPLHFRVLDDDGNFRVQFFHDVVRGAARHEDCPPLADFETRHAGFSESRHLREGRGALR